MASDPILEQILSTRIPPVGQHGRDWWSTLSQLRQKLKSICDVPMVQVDPMCQRILQRMVEAANMKEIDALMDELGARIAAMLTERGADKDLDQYGLGRGRRGRASLKAVEERTFLMDGEALASRARTRIRL